MGFLAAIGIAATIALPAALILRLIRLLMRKPLSSRAEQAAARTAVTVREFSTAEHPYDQRRRQYLRGFKERYDKLFLPLHIPAGADIVVKCCCVFSLEHLPIRHYAWYQDDALCFFPVWEDIAVHIADPAYLHPFAGKDTALIFGWKIPSAGLETYDVESEGNYTAVHYHGRRGKEYRTVLLDGGAELLRLHFPERDGAAIRRAAYLSSPDNLSDIRLELLELERLLGQGQIGREEYEVKKERLIRRL